MKAVVYHGPGDIGLEDVPEPQVKGKKVLVSFKVGSICGTDLHFYRGEWKIKKGRIIGHDACGVRADTGERVVMIPLTYCGSCYFCKRGMPGNCEGSGRSLGINKGGLFAESIAINPKYLVPIPDNVNDEEAGIMEPVALAVHVVDRLKPNIGDWVTVIGQGPIGLVMTQVARLKGCRVIAVDLEDYRLELAENYGAEFCINSRKENAAKKVKEITKRGSDVVIEAAGNTRAVEQTPFMVRKAGSVALLGEFRGRMNFEESDDACFFTSYVSPFEYPLAVKLVDRKLIDVKGLITHRFPLKEFEKAIQTANDPSKKPLKILITA